MSGVASNLRSADTDRARAPDNPRFPLIDSLRAMAALSVLLIHTAFLSGAIFTSPFKRLMSHLNVGVTLFFLISGFLLYRPFVAARTSRGGRVRTLGYARRRILRIFPAYWLALTAMALYPGLLGVFSGNWWVYYGLLQNYVLIYHADPGCAQKLAGCGIAQTWSLVIEVAYYALLPLYAWIVSRLLRGRPLRRQLGWELAILAVLGIGSACLGSLLPDTSPLRWTTVTVLGFFLWFAIGMGMAAISVAVHGREERWRLGRWITRAPLISWLGAALLYLALSYLLLPPSAGALTGFQQLLTQVMFGAIAALLMAPAVFGAHRGGIPRRILANRLLGWLGLISYGIFLWHLTIAINLSDFAGRALPGGHRFAGLTALVLGLTLPCAAVSYYLVERPLMRFRRRAGSRHEAAPGAAAVPREPAASSAPPVVTY